MTKGVKSKHFHVTRHGRYITKVGWEVSRIKQGFAEQLIREEKVKSGEQIPEKYWRSVLKNLESHTTRWTSGSVTYAAQSSRLRELAVILVQKLEDTFGLALVIPPTFDILLEHELRGCGIQVGEESYSAGQLEHGKAVGIRPHADMFSTNEYGPWPESVDIRRWTCGACGLDRTGSVFALRQGEWRRQLAGSVIRWGETVRFLYMDEWTLNLRIPNREPLGKIESWTLDAYELPNFIDWTVHSWFENRGLRVKLEIPTLEFVNPAVTFTDPGIRQFPKGDTICFSVSGVPDDQDLILQLFGESANSISGEPNHDAWEQPHTSGEMIFELRGLTPGVYELALLTDGRVSANFGVVDPPDDSPGTKPLSFRCGERMFSGLDSSAQAPVLLSRDLDIPEICITAPAKVRWRWQSFGMHHGWYSDVTGIASEEIRYELRRRLDSGELPSELTIDAGGFGQIAARFDRDSLLKTAPSETKHVDSARLRWLASLATSGSRTTSIGLSVDATRLHGDLENFNRVQWDRIDRKFLQHLRNLWQS